MSLVERLSIGLELGRKDSEWCHGDVGAWTDLRMDHHPVVEPAELVHHYELHSGLTIAETDRPLDFEGTTEHQTARPTHSPGPGNPYLTSHDPRPSSRFGPWEEKI